MYCVVFLRQKTMSKESIKQILEIYESYYPDKIKGLARHFIKQGYATRSGVEKLRVMLSGNQKKPETKWNLPDEMIDDIIEQMRVQYVIMRDEAKSKRK